MAQSTFTHDSTPITITNCIKSSQSTEIKKTRLPKGSWQKKLDKINKKINEYKINQDIEWMISINNQTIQSNDINNFQQIMSSLPPPIHIKIVQVRSRFPLKFHVFLLRQLYEQKTLRKEICSH